MDALKRAARLPSDLITKITHLSDALTPIEEENHNVPGKRQTRREVGTQSRGPL